MLPGVEVSPSDTLPGGLGGDSATLGVGGATVEAATVGDVGVGAVLVGGLTVIVGLPAAGMWVAAHAAGGAAHKSPG